MESLYQPIESKAAVLKIYDHKLEELNIDYHTKTINTSFGDTHVIITGEASKPPLVLVHGSNGCAPIALETYPTLSSRFQVFAVDVIAQPNKSAETRPDMKSNKYGDWLLEVIKELGLKDVTLAGFSFGGLVILKTLLADESNIKAAYLTCPAFIVNGNPFKAMTQMFFPMKKYMKNQDPKHLEKFLGALFSERDEFAVNFLSKVFVHFNMDFSPIPVISKQEAASIKTPITLIGAEHDLIFPGAKMLKRAKKIFPSLKETVFLENSKHVQNREDNDRIEAIIV